MNGFFSRMLLVALTAAPMLLQAGPPAASTTVKLDEAHLIRQLQSPDSDKVLEALDKLGHDYPQSTNAVPAIIDLLKERPVRRWAARALGDRHVELSPDDLKLVFILLRSPDRNECMDGLKTLRDLKEPDSLRPAMTGEITPLLHDSEVHIVRDACRTLAMVGTKDAVPLLEPLLHHPRADVRQDAGDAITALSAGH